MFVWLISHQPAVFFSQNKSATSNQPAVLFSQNKSAQAKRTGQSVSYHMETKKRSGGGEEEEDEGGYGRGLAHLLVAEKYPRDLLAAPRILLKMMNYERCWADIEPG
jgi:hypothetical protein